MQNRRATSLAERGEIAAFRQAALLRIIATDPLVRRGVRHVVAMTGGIPGLRDVLDHKAGPGSSPPRALPAGGTRRTTPSDTVRAAATGASGAAPPTRAQRRLERVVKHQAALAQSGASLPRGVAPGDGSASSDATEGLQGAAKRFAKTTSRAAVASARPPQVPASDSAETMTNNGHRVHRLSMVASSRRGFPSVKLLQRHEGRDTSGSTA